MHMLTIQEAANRLGISRLTVNAMRRAGEFAPEIQLSRRRVGFLETDFDEWIASRRSR
jgi:excisionase family DNA binding protein